MTISETIYKLQQLQKEHGDINVCLSEHHDYWGSVESHLEDFNISVKNDAQPNGPKSGKMETAVVIKPL